MDSYVSPSDVQTFLNGTNAPLDGGSFTEIGTGDSLVDHREATMDVETIAALAPGANVKLYRISSLSADDVVAGMQEADYYNEAAVVSMSIDRCEGATSDINFPNPYGAAIAMDAAAEQGSAQGITFAAGTGDSGQPKYLSGCPSVMAPADSQNVVAVGGTSPYNTNFQLFSASHAYEMNPSGAGWQYAWGETVNGAGAPCATNWCGTGGGESTHFLTGFQHNIYNSSWRAEPDLSMAADVFFPTLIILDGAWSEGSGTSFAVQQFAALQIEIDQRQNTRKGNVVPAIWNAYFNYKYGPLGPGLPRVYDDIIQGNTGIQASVGPDWSSGIGAVDGYALSSVE
jgi:subtilase family serine protease